MASGLTQPDPRVAALNAPQEQMDPELLSMMDQVTSEMSAELDTQVQNDTAQFDANYGRAAGVGVRALGSVASGISKALDEGSDTIFGDTNYQDKSAARRERDKVNAAAGRMGAGYSITQGISQFVTGFLATPSGKVAGPAKLAKFGYETLRGAAVGSVVFDPQEDRLSNLVQQYPSLQNPVTAYLAANPDDSNAEGRFKNALEGIGMDFAVAAAFALGAKALKFRKAGNVEAADKAVKQAQAQLDEYEARPAQGALGPTQQKFANGPTVEAPPSSAPRPAADLKPGDARSKIAAGDGFKEAQAIANDAPNVEITQGKPTDIPKKPKAPKIASDDEVKRLVEASDIRKAGERGNPAEMRGVSPGGYVNWTKIAGPEDVGVYTAKVAKILEPRIKQAVQSDAYVDQMVRLRAVAFNEDPEALISMLRRSGANAKTMAADMEASYVVANGLFKDAYQLASKIRTGLLDEFGGSAEAATQELSRRASIAAQVMESARSMTASSGRTMRRMQGQFKITPEQVDLMKVDGNMLVDAIYHSQGDPSKMAKALDPSLFKRMEKTFTTLITNGPLWWYPTHVINGIGNLYLLAARPTERLLGSLLMDSIDGAMGREAGGAIVRRRALKEYRASVSAIHDGWDAAVGSFLKGDSIMSPHESFYMDEAAAQGQQLQVKKVTSVEDVIHNALQFANPMTAVAMPGRTLGAVDELVKTIRYRAVLQARAAVEAEELGMVGKQIEDYIKQRLNEGFDEMGKATDIEALTEARHSTLTNPLQPGTVGAGLQHMVANTPMLRAVFTYVRTPINAIRYGIRMTPGLQLVQKEFRDMLASPNPTVRAQAYGQMSMGALWMGAVAPFVASGMVTGGGPSDPKLSAELRAQGWRPYSLVWEKEDGTKSYYPLGRLDPPGLLIGMMADAWDIMQHKENYEEGENILAVVSMALLKNIMNKTYLTGLDNTVKALRDPDQNLLKWVGNTAEAAMPFSALMRGANNDPYVREARSFTDHVMDNTPGLSKTMEPKYNALGEPIRVNKGLWSDAKLDVVDAEMQRLILETGKGLVPVSPSRQSGVDLRDFQLKNGRSAYAVLNETIASMGPVKMKDRLGKLIKSSQYQQAPDGVGDAKGSKLWMINQIVGKYREAGWKKVLRDNPDLAEAIRSDQRKAKAAYDAKAHEQRQGGSLDAAIQSLVTPQ